MKAVILILPLFFLHQIFQLEHDLAETQKAAGLPVAIPKESGSPSNQRVEKTVVTMGNPTSLPKSPGKSLLSVMLLFAMKETTPTSNFLK